MPAQQDGTGEFDDPELLDRAAALGRLLFAYDADFLVETQRRMVQGVPFVGVVYGRESALDIGGWIEDLALIAEASDLLEWEGRVQYLPLR